MSPLRHLRNAAEQVVVLLVLAVLRLFDLVGPTPFWVFVALLGAGAVLQQPGVQDRLGGGTGERLWLRVGSRIAINTTLIYAIGWGAMLAVAHLNVLSRFVRQDGSRAWRPLAVCSAVSLLIGQVAIGCGLFSYLPLPEGHGVALLIGLGVVSTSAVLGEAVRRREEAEAALRASEGALRASEERFAALLYDGADIITLTDADGQVVYVSPTAARITGHDPASLLGDGLWTHLHPDDYAAAAEFNARIRAEPDVVHARELRIRHADGSWRWHEFVTRNLLTHPGVRAIVGHHRDIHDRRTAQEQILYAATHDELTGVLNNSAVKLMIEQTLAGAAEGGYPVGLLFLDLDGFKQVNDDHGHAAGDEKLQLVSRVLESTGRERDVIGRIGGDEFVVLCNGVAGPEQLEAQARLILAGIADAQPPGESGARVGCSIGIALADPGTLDAKALLRRADAAMYVSKRRGPNGYEVFADSMIANAG
ncbi:diguanylate cyclase [Cryptosporangium phraense]|uniref:Diguanylate cyclase n=1 Tax=Cryptosporangium phraense TaxID=2593070 RepID=A0A545AS86_9ACTN|nr:diguanylate cyclase [Cryptosporangium phraense]TQS44196.1 diguanylate cyclase [Cryptosporangium phraense]